MHNVVFVVLFVIVGACIGTLAQRVYKRIKPSISGELIFWHAAMLFCTAGLLLVPLVLFVASWGISDGRGGSTTFVEEVFLWYVAVGVPLLVITGWIFVRQGVKRQNLALVRLGASIAYGTLIPGLMLAQAVNL